MANVAHHYDIGNALYALMLDPEHMQYSCAYWTRDTMTLGEAQEAKLAHIAAKLALHPGDRVLDIGCGWGGRPTECQLVRYRVENSHQGEGICCLECNDENGV